MYNNQNSVCGICYNSIVTKNPFRYRGYYYDAEIGIYYLQSRYYDPNTGRFINADSPEYASVTGNNLFAYCNNNPVMNVDYFGFCYLPTNYPYYADADRQEPGIIETLLKTLGGILGIISLFTLGTINEICGFFERHPVLLEIVQTAILLIGYIFSAPWTLVVSIILQIIALIIVAHSPDSSLLDWAGAILGFFKGVKFDALSLILPHLDFSITVN